MQQCPTFKLLLVSAAEMPQVSLNNILFFFQTPEVRIIRILMYL